MMVTKLVWIANEILESDADEILLDLLAKDTESIYKPDKPHRRYVNPDYDVRTWYEKQFHPYNWIYYRGKPRGWKQISYDWWIKDGDNYGRPNATNNNNNPIRASSRST